MHRVSLEIIISAPVERVWRALCDPAEVVQWDAGNIQPVNVPATYPVPRQHATWRYRGDTNVLHDQPVEVVPNTRLRSLLTNGRSHFDETYDLTSVEPNHTHLRCTLLVSTALPVIGRLIERVVLVPRTHAAFEASLISLKRHCEAA